MLHPTTEVHELVNLFKGSFRMTTTPAALRDFCGLVERVLIAQKFPKLGEAVDAITKYLDYRQDRHG